MPIIGSSKLQITGDITASGAIVAEEFKTDFVSGSILYNSGSSKFGDTRDDTHEFTGSISLSGSNVSFLGGSDVGIGTASPDVNFHIKLADTANARIEDTSTDGIAKLDFKNDARTSTIGLYGDDSDNFKIDHGGGSVISIDVGQNVTFPVANTKISGSTTSTGSFGNVETTKVRFTKGVVSTEAGVIGLHTNNYMYVFGGTTGLALMAETGIDGIKILDGGSGGAGSVNFETNNNTRVTINGSGNVGIGTTVPSQPLTVAGNISGSGNLDIDGTGELGSHLYVDGNITASGNISASGTVFANTFESFGGDSITIDDSMNVVGNVSGSVSSTGSFGSLVVADRVQGSLIVTTAASGVGTTDRTDADDLVVENSNHGGISILTPDDKFSNIAFGSPSDNRGAVLDYSHGTKVLNIGSDVASGQVAIKTAAGTEAVRVDASQNVGIGVTNPVVKLDVYGSVNLRSEYNLTWGGTAGANIPLIYGKTGDGGHLAFHSQGTDGESLRLDASNNAIFAGNVSGSVSSTGSFGQLKLKQNNIPANPTLNFGDGDTGFYEKSDDILGIAFAGNERFLWRDGRLSGIAGSDEGPAMMREAESATNPVWSFEDDQDTGIGRASANNLSLIAGGTELLRIGSDIISGSANVTASFGHLILTAASKSPILRLQRTDQAQGLEIVQDNTGDVNAFRFDYKDVATQYKIMYITPAGLHIGELFEGTDFGNNALDLGKGESATIGFANDVSIQKSSLAVSASIGIGTTSVPNQGLEVAVGNISGSVFSTGSFGRVEADIFSGSFHGQIGARYVHVQSTAGTTWTIPHNLGSQYPNVTVYDESDEMVLPTSVTATNTNTMTLTFNIAVAGVAMVGLGGHSSNQGRAFVFSKDDASANWAVTHSLGEQYPAVTVYDESDRVIIPENIHAVGINHSEIFFDQPTSGKAHFSVGNGLPSINSSNAGNFMRVNSDGTNIEYTTSTTDVTGSLSVSGSIEIIGGDGTVSGTPESDGDELVIRNNARAGLGIIAGEGSGISSNVIFGSTSDINGANLSYTFNTKTMALRTQHASGILTLGSGNAATAVTIDASQNVGIGVTPEAHNSLFTSLQIGGNTNISTLKAQGASGEVDFGHNFYFAASGQDKYISTDEATQFRQSSGNFRFRTAPSGTADDVITFTERMIITQAGNVGIGTSNPEAKLDVVGDVKIKGDLTAETLIISSSVTNLTTQFASGSTRFGDSLDDTHEITGSLSITGSGDSVFEVKAAQATVPRFRVDNDSDNTIGINCNPSNAIVDIRSTGNDRFLMSFLNGSGTDIGGFYDGGGSLNLFVEDASSNRNAQIEGSTGDFISNAGSFISKGTNAKISGSSTSTGSFGHLIIPGPAVVGNGFVTTIASGSSFQINDTGGTSVGVNYRHVTNDVGKGFFQSFLASTDAGGVVEYGRIKNEIIGRVGGAHSGAFRFYLAHEGASTERFTILNSGKVGIGTTAPAAILHIETDEPELFLKHTGTSGDDKTLITFGDKNGQVHAQFFTKLKNDANGGAFDSEFHLQTAADGTVADRIVVEEDGKAILFPTVSALISGSSTSTGSFKRMVVGCAPSDVNTEFNAALHVKATADRPVPFKVSDESGVSLFHSISSNHTSFQLYQTGGGPLVSLHTGQISTFEHGVSGSVSSTGSFGKIEADNGITTPSLGLGVVTATNDILSIQPAEDGTNVISAQDHDGNALFRVRDSGAATLMNLYDGGVTKITLDADLDGGSILTEGNVSGSSTSTGSFGNLRVGDVTGNAFGTNFYEEGEYTATIICQGSGTITVNSSFDQLRFTRIGRVVHVQGVIIVSSVSSPVGTLVSINLPFTSANDGGDTADRVGGQYTYYDNSESTHTMFPLFVDENASSMVVHFNGVASMPNVNTIAASDQFRIDLTYTI